MDGSGGQVTAAAKNNEMLSEQHQGYSSRVPANGPEDLAAFEKWLNEFPNKERTVTKVGFQGSINLATAAALDEIMDSKAELFASLRRRERTTDLVIVPDELDQDCVSLSGYARDTWNALHEMAREDNTVAQDALRLFYRLSAQDDSK